MKYLTNPEKDIQQLESLFGVEWAQKNPLAINTLYIRQRNLQNNITNRPSTTLKQRQVARQTLESLDKWYAILNNPTTRSQLITQVQRYSQTTHLQDILDDLLEELPPKTPNQSKLSRQPTEDSLLNKLVQKLAPPRTQHNRLSRSKRPRDMNQAPIEGSLLDRRKLRIQPLNLIKKQKEAEAIEEQELLKRAKHKLTR